MNEKYALKQINVNGEAFNYFTVGDASNPALLLFHAAYADHHIFDSQIDALSKSHYMITLDYPGHGIERQMRSSFLIKDVPMLVETILEDEGVASVHIIGVSLGALIAQYFCSVTHRNILSLALVGGYSVLEDNKALLKLQNKEMIKLMLKLIFSPKAFRNAIASEATQSKQGREVFQKALEGFGLKHMRAFATANQLMQISSWQYTFPMLLITGEFERSEVIKHNQAWAQRSEAIAHRQINVAGHCANLDQPIVFVETYNAWREDF